MGAPGGVRTPRRTTAVRSHGRRWRGFMKMFRWSLALAAAVVTVLPATSHAIGLGRFAASCGYVKSEIMDPIVAPGVQPFGHMHDFFGANQINPFSTGPSLAATAPDTSCDRLSDAA